MWLVGDADVLLVGSTGPLDDRIAGMPAAWKRPGVAADLASVEVQSPFSVASLFVAQGPALAAWAAGAELQTDDRSAPGVLRAAGHFRGFARRQRRRRARLWRQPARSRPPSRTRLAPPPRWTGAIAD